MSEDDKTKPFTGEPATDAKQTAPVTQAQSGEKPKRKTAAKALRTPEDLAAKAEHKAVKQQAKDAAKAARQSRKAETAQAAPDPETAAARAARKAAKLEAQAARRASKPAALPENVAARTERKAAKRAAKEADKEAAQTERAAKKAAAASDEAAAKAQRKAAKEAAKEAAKAERAAEKAVVTPQEAAAKAQRKAAKDAAKAERAAKKAAEPPEDEAAKAERKAAKEAAKAERAAKKAAAPPEDDAAKAERKAAKQEAKAARKSAMTPEEAAAKAERKAAKLQVKEAAKAARKSEKPDAAPLDAAAKAERKAAKQEAKAVRKSAMTPEEAAAKAERKAAKRAAKAEKRKRDDSEAGERDPRAVRLSLAGTSPEAVAPLGAAIENEFRVAGVATEAPKPEGKADLIIHTFDNPDADAVARYEATIANARARVHAFVEPLEGGADLNRVIARLAAATGGTVVRAPAKLKRFGLEETLTGGRPNEKGLKLIAESVVGLAAALLPKHRFTRPDVEAAPDLVAARAAAASPDEFLAKLRWSGAAPPKSMKTPFWPEDVEAFADSKIVFSEISAVLSMPVDWGMELPDRNAGYMLNGLDFLAAPLAYWYAKANNQTSERIAAIDAALKGRGTTPNLLLARATQIILDFLEKHPRSSAPAVWDDRTLTKRVRVLALFILCCKSALKRKMKFNETACATVFGALLDHCEVLRADDFYKPCSVDGIEQDCTTIGIALALRGTEYGNLLLSDSLQRLKRLQIDPGLSAEGVWLGDSYGTHCAALAMLTGLFADFPPADAALIEPFTGAAKRMTAFAEAMLKSNGQPPAIDESKEKSYAERLSGVRKTIARAGGKQTPTGKPQLRTRITDTYVFREAQYFISHSSQKVSPDSSLVVLHAAAPSMAREDPGGVTLVFAYGESNLLIRTEPAEDAAAAADEQAGFDPALRNGYRIDGEGNLPPEGEAGKSAAMVKSWRGPGWAAAKSFESNYDGASVGRTVVHLKAAHALIVVDELASDDGEAAVFEQFWNIAPEFAPPEVAEQPLRFLAAGKGCLTVSLAGVEPVSVGSGQAGARIRCEAHLGRGLTAALFQWTDEPAPAALDIERDGAGDWVIVASGKDFSVRLSLAGSEFGCALTGP